MTMRASSFVAIMLLTGPGALRGQGGAAAAPQLTLTLGAGRLIPVGDPYRYTDRTIRLHQRPGLAVRLEGTMRLRGPISLRGSMTSARQSWELPRCWYEGCMPTRDIGHYTDVRLRYYELGTRIDLLHSELGAGQWLFVDLGGGVVEQQLKGPEWNDVSPRHASNGTGSVGVGVSTALPFGLTLALEVEDKISGLTPIQRGTSRKPSHSVGLTAGVDLVRF